MRLYVMRHGETDWNIGCKLQGITDIPLNENGRKVARLTAEAVKDVHFDLRITSGYLRTDETAEIVTRHADIPHIRDERIHEISWASWEGRPSDGTGYEETKKQLELFFSDQEAFVGAPDGETFFDIEKRIRAFLKDVISNPDYEDKTILIATHGTPMRMMQKVIKPSEKGYWREHVPYNCATCIMDFQNGELVSFEEDQVFYDESLIVDYYTLKEYL